MNVVAHNLQAMNSQRQLNITASAKQKSAEKLSSGYRINRAADDAAGLAVSEKMRRQIRGLDRGVDNCEDGVSLCQIADGALTEVNTMLQRLTTLTVQAANGTNASSDRAAIQKEINQILSEIQRIGDTTTFNGTQVFNTNYSSPVEGVGYENYSLSSLVPAQIDASKAGNIDYMPFDVSYNGGVSAYDETTSLFTNSEAATSFTLRYTDGAGNIARNSNITANDLSLTNYSLSNGVMERTFKYTDAANNIDLDIKQTITTGANGAKAYDIKYDFTNNGIAVKLEGFKVEGSLADDSGKFYDIYSPNTLSGDDSTLSMSFSASLGSAPAYGGTSSSRTANTSFSLGIQDSSSRILGSLGNTKGNSMWLQAGNECMEGFRLEMGTLSNKYLGIDELSVMTEEKATSAIDLIGVALQKVTSERATIGAQQNRLEHTIANEENTVENTTASESRIRDTDMAEEMVRFSKNSILEQAGQAMLAQANSSMEGVLSLLQ